MLTVDVFCYVNARAKLHTFAFYGFWYLKPLSFNFVVRIALVETIFVLFQLEEETLKRFFVALQ